MGKNGVNMGKYSIRVKMMLLNFTELSVTFTEYNNLVCILMYPRNLKLPPYPGVFE